MPRIVAVFVFALCPVGHSADEPLISAKALTPLNSFTTGIEGPHSNNEGIVYCVNYGHRGTVARTTPDGKTKIFVELPMAPPDAKGNPSRASATASCSIRKNECMWLTM